MADLRECYEALRRIELGAISIKEILCAVAGLKVTRVSVADRERFALEQLLPSQGLEFVVSETKRRVARDHGKGGWSNKFADAAPVDDPDGYWTVYVGTQSDILAWAHSSDVSSRNNLFGEALGIPECCRRFFDDNIKQAFVRQGDLLLFTLHNTKASPPFNRWVNYACQYFGYCLLSFAACSFDCAHAARVAQRTYAFLRDIDPEFADRFLWHHSQSVFYTEHDGIFLLLDARYSSGVLRYSKVRSTSEESEIAKAVCSGNNIAVVADDAFAIRKDDSILAVCEGDECGLCAF
jgi:hypothetical protein